ncbi:Protein saf4 [Microbotryomycetes sp. JL201]|nr:Protein saf4 [Microbotryomycetes sp. JL201]
MQGFNKYYPPDYDPSHGSLNKYHGKHALGDRARKLDKGILIVRFELPFNIWCGNCNNHIGQGVRYNAEKSKHWFEIRTDPQNTRYVVHSGARQKNEEWDPAENGGIVLDDKKDGEPPDAFAALEKSQKQKTKALSEAAHLQALEDDRAAHWSDPYAASTILRNKFRKNKKVRLESEARAEDVRSKYGLGDAVQINDLRTPRDAAVKEAEDREWEAARIEQERRQRNGVQADPKSSAKRNGREWDEPTRHSSSSRVASTPRTKKVLVMKRQKHLRNNDGDHGSDSDGYTSSQASSASSSSSSSGSGSSASDRGSMRPRKHAKIHRMHLWYHKAKRKLKTRLHRHRRSEKDRYEGDRRHHRRLKRATKKSLSFFEQHVWLIACVAILFILTLALLIVLAARENPNASAQHDPETPAPHSSPSSATWQWPRSGSPEAIASAFSMTRAAVSQLQMPKEAIEQAEDATKFIKETWSWKKGGSDYLSFRPDPFERSGGLVLAIEYPKGSYSGSKSGGGVGGLHLGIYGDAAVVERTVIAYEVAFDENFDFVKGGKLPGAFGGAQSDGCTGGEQSAACFSLRLMWREEGAGEVYAYIPRYDAMCAHGAAAECNDVYGVSLNRGSWTFQTGRWTQVVQVAALNSEPDASRTTANDFASDGGRTYYRNFQFFAGKEASSALGNRVEAHVAKRKT